MKLRPCPFCGGEATQHEPGSLGITCPGCFETYNGDPVVEESRWGSRPIEDELRSRIETTKAYIEKRTSHTGWIETHGADLITLLDGGEIKEFP